MKRKGLWAACVVLLVGMGVLAVGTVSAGDENAKDENAVAAKCSEATLRGMYLFAVDGVDITGNDQVPIAAAGYLVFNGNGKVDQLSSVNLNGKVFRNVRDKATYNIKADCTGTVTYPDRSRIDVFIAPNGSMFTAIRTKPSEIVTSGFELRGTAKRVAQ